MLGRGGEEKVGQDPGPRHQSAGKQGAKNPSQGDGGRQTAQDLRPLSHQTSRTEHRFKDKVN